MSLLKLLAKYNQTLHEHLSAPTMKCVTHISPQTQNELDIIEAHSMIASTKDVYANKHTEVDNNFQKIHDHAVSMAEKVGCM